MPSEPCVALLRGINVGGKNLVAMGDLRECVQGLGHSSVRTYINSGNVLFRPGKAVPPQLEGEIENALSARFSRPIRVLVRTLSEMEGVIARLPSRWADPTGLRCNVIFLSRAIDRADLVDQFPIHPELEQLAYHPGVLFWSARAADVTRTTMARVNRMPVYQEMTVRNLNTTRRVFELLRELP